MNPVTGSPGTGVQHLENFTMQLSSPDTMMPLLDRLGARMESLGVEGYTVSPVEAAAWMASASARWRSSRPSRVISSLMRAAAFWADSPP